MTVTANKVAISAYGKNSDGSIMHHNFSCTTGLQGYSKVKISLNITDKANMMSSDDRYKVDILEQKLSAGSYVDKTFTIPVTNNNVSIGFYTVSTSANQATVVEITKMEFIK